MDIKPFFIGKETTDEEVSSAMEEFSNILSDGRDVAFVIRKGALSYGKRRNTLMNTQ